MGGENGISGEPALRLAVFAGVLLVTAAAEALLPRRRPAAGKSLRWVNNLALVGLNTVVARLLLPLGAVGLAVVAERRGWGLFNNVAVPGWLAVVLSVVLLDLSIYLQHVRFHACPALSRRHRVPPRGPGAGCTAGPR